MKRLLSSIFLFLLVLCATAQKEYYTSVDGVKGGASLKTALHNLIKNHKKISYGSGEEKTWGAFYTTDAVVENGQRRVLDMYSAEKRYFGSKGSAVSGMNIEHSVAKSWWGGNENNAYCDIHHLNPSDQNANSRKSNYPLGELTSISWENGVTFVGKANIDGSSTNAYEPCDEYKGDFARVFMYMFTCYQDLTWKYTWMNYENSTYPTLKPWAVKLLLKWHKQDPVSEKEVNRNNAVYAVQGNRNPFIDYPQLADYVWGDSINYVFHLTGEVEGGTGGSTDDDDNTGDGDNTSKDDFEVVDGWKIYLNEDFDGTTMKFTTYEGVGYYPWTLNSQYKYAVASSYVSDSKTNNDAESWLLSPSFDFSNDSIATISFDYVIRYCESGKAAEHHALMICSNFEGDPDDATWEKIDFSAAENTTDWTLTKTGDITIPQKYMGEKNVTLAFFYKGTETKAGTFEIDNVIVKAMEGANNGGNAGGDNGDGNEGENGGDDNEDNGGNDGNFTGGEFVLVTDASQLTTGDLIVIGYENYAMGASAGNYRHKTDMMTSDGVITYLADDVQIILLEEGAVDGTYALNVGNGYLAASSSSSNYVATNTVLDANGSWKIVINDGLAVITAQGDKSRNTLQYNTSAPRFSCYKSGQKSVNIYAKSPTSTGIVDIEDDGTVDVYTIAGILVRKNVDNSNARQGLQRGFYIVGDKKYLVK